MKNKNFFLSLKLPTKKRWLKNWWQKNINTFVYAIENPEIKKEIENWRKRWTNGETSTTPDGLYKILKRVFLNDLGGKPILKRWVRDNCTIRREGDEYYSICKNKDGRETKWYFPNPFVFFDGEILVPEAKMKLLTMLSNIHKEENQWILEPRLFIQENAIIYPPSHILISTLHEFRFLDYVKFWILRRLNLDYFVFWPMFFFYALTDDIEYTIKNATVFIYPIQIFLVDENTFSPKYLVFRLYGDCNFNEIFNFIKDNKSKLNRLNKLMGNPNISARSLRDFYFYSSEKKPKELSLELFGEDFTNKVEGNPYLKGLLREAKKSKDPAYIGAPQLKEITKEKENIIKVTKSLVKSEIETITKVDQFDPEIKKLIDEINNPRI